MNEKNIFASVTLTKGTTKSSNTCRSSIVVESLYLSICLVQDILAKVMNTAEKTASIGQCSSGWMSTQRSLTDQGYTEANRCLWLLQPSFLAQKVSSTSSPNKATQRRKLKNQTRKATIATVSPSLFIKSHLYECVHKKANQSNN